MSMHGRCGRVSGLRVGDCGSEQYRQSGNQQARTNQFHNWNSLKVPGNPVRLRTLIRTRFPAKGGKESVNPSKVLSNKAAIGVRPSICDNFLQRVPSPLVHNESCEDRTDSSSR